MLKTATPFASRVLTALFPSRPGPARADVHGRKPAARTGSTRPLVASVSRIERPCVNLVPLAKRPCALS